VSGLERIGHTRCCADVRRTQRAQRESGLVDLGGVESKPVAEEI